MKPINLFLFGLVVVIWGAATTLAVLRMRARTRARAHRAKVDAEKMNGHLKAPKA